VIQVLDALAQAHALGIVHRDLKPANVFLARRRDGTETVKLLDFGVSKVLRPAGSLQGAALTHSASVLGSPLYMAPEQIEDPGSVDARTDIWAIGTILFELMSGKPAFDAPTVGSVFVAIVSAPIPSVRALRPEVPRELDAVVMRCLARDRQERFGDVGQLARALHPFAPPESQLLAERLGRTASLVPDALARTTPQIGNAPGFERGVGATTGRPWSSGASKSRAPARWSMGMAVGVSAIALAAGGWIWTRPDHDRGLGGAAQDSGPSLPRDGALDNPTTQASGSPATTADASGSATSTATGETGIGVPEAGTPTFAVHDGGGKHQPTPTPVHLTAKPSSQKDDPFGTPQ
jgi:serine/threonine-protein kinase